MVRVILLQGWYIITYALGIYYLNLFIAFLTPMINPSVQEDMAGKFLIPIDDSCITRLLTILLSFLVDEDGPTLPTSSSDEFRPFIRRLPEFKFWHNFTKATMIAFSLTFFEVFNIPVFWPILLLYFITLMFITLKRQIMHMIKYGYVPWTRNKTRYAGREDTGRVVYSQWSLIYIDAAIVKTLPVSLSL